MLLGNIARRVRYTDSAVNIPISGAFSEMSCDTERVPSRVVSRPEEGRAVAAFLGAAAAEPACLVAEGEPGIGKTTLCLSTVELAHERGFVVLAARPAEAESVLHLGRLCAEAEPMVGLLERNGRRLDRPWMNAVGARCRGMMLAAGGDVDGANRAVQQALTEHDRLPMPFERARTQLLAGQLLRRQRQKDQAATTLREVLQTFEDLDTRLRPIAPAPELARIYRKLGIHSRAELRGCARSRR